MLFIDSHCHLHDSRIGCRVNAIIDRAKKAGIRYMVSCATMPENFGVTRRLSCDEPAVLPCFGIHPWFLDTLSKDWKTDLESWLEAVPSGVGETGLDFTDKRADRDRQMAVFEHHLALARALGRPVNIHIRKAWDAFIHMLKRTGPLDVPGIIHSYSGSADMIPVFEKYNLFISFSGSVTKPNARKVAAALAAVPENRYVIETDSPDMYPQIPDPDPSGLNEPANLPLIAAIASDRIGVSRELFCERAYENGCRVFQAVIEGKR